MDDLEKLYGKQTFVLYGLFAKVPGKKVWPRVIFLILSIAVLFWATVLQILKIVIEKFQRRFIIELLPSTLATFGCLSYIPYVAFATEEGFNALLSIMQSDLKAERTEEENAIKQRYYKETKMLVNGYSTLCGLAICCIFLSGFLPNVLDLLLPLNQTRERQFLVHVDFYVDEEKYHYHIYFLECCGALVLGVVIIITENMGVIIGQHACSMIAVLGHQLETLTHFDNHKELDKDTYERLMMVRFRRCIKGHQKVGQFGVLIAAFYDTPLTVVLAGTFCSLTICLVQVTNPELMNTTNIIFTIVQVFQLYVLSYMGQCGINCADKLRINACNLRWYLCSPKQRKLLQLIILRATKPCLITARNMYTYSMENFIMVMQTVTSFYVVLRGTQ